MGWLSFFYIAYTTGRSATGSDLLERVNHSSHCKLGTLLIACVAKKPHLANVSKKRMSTMQLEAPVLTELPAW